MFDYHLTIHKETARKVCFWPSQQREMPIYWNHFFFCLSHFPVIWALLIAKTPPSWGGSLVRCDCQISCTLGCEASAKSFLVFWRYWGITKLQNIAFFTVVNGILSRQLLCVVSALVSPNCCSYPHSYPFVYSIHNVEHWTQKWIS